MSDTSKKAREFWIDEIIDDVDEIGLPYLGAYFEPTPERSQTHVIEHSTYEELKQQALLMREALEEIAKESPNMDVPTAYRYKALADFLREQAEQALEQFDEFMKDSSAKRDEPADIRAENVKAKP